MNYNILIQRIFNLQIPSIKRLDFKVKYLVFKYIYIYIQYVEYFYIKYYNNHFT